MRRQRRGLQLLALILGLSLVAAACGGDDDDSDSGSSGEEGGEEAVAGGELVDLGTFVGDPPEHIDPALNVTLDAYQVVNALYDGLTEIDISDPENPQAVGQVAESWESNEEATEWTFTIRDGLTFSDGTEVLPSSFTRAWERASDPDFAGDYSYLFSFIEGGAGEARRQGRGAGRCRGRRRRDDPQGHPVGALLELPLRGRLPDLHADAGGRRRARRPGRVGERADGRQRAVHARRRPHRPGDQPGAEPRVGRHPVRRGARPAGRAVPRVADLPGLGRSRHRVQRVGGRRGRHRQRAAGPRAGGGGQLRDHPRRADRR